MGVMLEKSLSTSMNARIIGSGDQTLVLAHGYGGDQSVWDKVLPHLAQRYQVLVFDWSFSGAIKDPNTLFDAVKFSSYDAFAEDLIALVDEMNLKSSVFVGHSMAGIIGCNASVKRPELFERLILVGSSPSSPPPPPTPPPPSSLSSPPTNTNTTIASATISQIQDEDEDEDEEYEYGDEDGDLDKNSNFNLCKNNFSHRFDLNVKKL